MRWRWNTPNSIGRPPQEHDALRKQIAQDLQRLESLNPHGDAVWLAFLLRGYKQSSASAEQVKATEQRLLRDYPHSIAAYEMVEEHCRKDHQEPEGQTDGKAFRAHDEAYKAALKQWIQVYSDHPFLQREAWFYFYAASGYQDVSEKEGVAAVEAFLQDVDEYQQPDLHFWSYLNAAQFLTRHGWQPERTLELMERSQKWLSGERAREENDDNLSAEDEKARADQVVWQDQARRG